MNDRELTTLIGLCSQWWPNFPKTESLPVLVTSWRRLLADIPFDAGVAALEEYAATGQAFPPPVGAIRRRAAMLAMPGGQAPTVDEAWGEVLGQLARVGHTVEFPGGPELVFSHPAITAVVASLGWRQLCESENQVADRAHFAQLYRERVEREINRAAEPPLVTEFRRQLDEADDAPRRIGEGIGRAVRHPSEQDPDEPDRPEDSPYA